MTNSLGRLVIVLLTTLSLLGLMTSRTKLVVNDWTEDELSYALRAASQDASAVMIDSNKTLDGSSADLEDIKVDVDLALRQFETSFACNIGSHINPTKLSNMNIPLAGYVGYRYIIGQTYDGTPTIPFAYTTVKGNTLYNFTLNEETVFESNNGGTGPEVKKNLSEYPEHFFSSVMDNATFRTSTIMGAINEFLTLYNAGGANLIAQTTGTSVQFELGYTDYSDNPAVLTMFASVIDGPGFFAVTDFLDPQLTGVPVRTFTFGGSELLSKP